MDPITDALTGNPPAGNSAGEGAGQPASNELSDLKSTVFSLKGSLDVLATQNAQLLERLSSKEKQGDSDSDDDVPPEFEDDDKKIERTAKKITADEFKKRDQAQAKASWDSRADSEFPDILDRSSDFYRAVYNQVHDPRITANKNDPKAVYDACARVKHQFELEGRSVKRPNVRQSGNGGYDSGGYVPGTGNNRGKRDSALSDGELYIASKIGRSPEQYKATRDRHFEKLAHRRELTRA